MKMVASQSRSWRGLDQFSIMTATTMARMGTVSAATASLRTNMKKKVVGEIPSRAVASVRVLGDGFLPFAALAAQTRANLPSQRYSSTRDPLLEGLRALAALNAPVRR